MNSFLRFFEKIGQYWLLYGLIYLMYRIKGKDIKEVRFRKDLGVWEYRIGNDYFFSSGPGWAYDYDYLRKQFADSVGLKYLPREGDCVVDVGAGVGEELLVFSKLVGKTGKVFAIEAHPKTFEALQANCRLNNIDNAILLNVAVSDKPGRLFIEGARNALGNKVSSVAAPDTSDVEAITVEQLIERHGINRINFMKVNIEGAEQLLIKGIGKAISKIDNMAISCHDFRYVTEGNEFFKTKAIVVDFLDSNGFDYVARSTDTVADSYVYASPKKPR
jgi:FkbM family methyltransferase